MTKVNLQNRKQLDSDPQDAVATKAALRAKVFAQYGAATLGKKDLEKKGRSECS